MATTVPRRTVRVCGVKYIFAVGGSLSLGLLLGLHISSSANLGCSGKQNADPLQQRDRFLRSSGETAKHKYVPQGPQSELYLEHTRPWAEFRLVYDSSKNFTSFGNVSITETMLLGKRTRPVKQKWIERSMRFRSSLAAKKLSTLQSDSPFLGNLNLDGIFADALNPTHGQCMCDPRNRPVVDMALVVPMSMAKCFLTWNVLESISQFTTYPKEIVFVVGDVKENPGTEFVAFVQLLVSYYVPLFPQQTKVMVFASSQNTKPGDGRWFGFNQTTAPIVTLFDNDDYMHPQYFHVFWRIFQKRPELDHALMVYEVGTVEGVCSEAALAKPIFTFLERQQFKEAHIAREESFPNSMYEELWGMIPTFNKTWWLGNTDAEPNWGNNAQEWWDYGCHNGWATFRRHVMESIPPPLNKYGGEDAIWNYRIGRAKFNYQCIKIVMGCFLKSYCR